MIARLLVKEDASNEPSTIHLQPEDEAELLGDIEERDNIAVKVNLKHKLDIDQEVIETIQANSATSIIESQNSLPIKISYANGESGSPSKKMLVCIEEKLLGSGVSKLNDKERLLARAQRFGSSGGGHCSGSLHSDEQLAARARRFGLPVAPNGASATIESRETSVVDKLKKRAERFGVTTSKKLELLYL
ncbi:unnamed protein product [Protopolystoma xenopodis]|uniref:THO1-MOS11 C-terminal domain-containing protein n=1 Tax=Protopolystoma xenopodis TaxID=117903 RepID=A0A448WR08_9PLAT|nr:unnamed protein product [Protopolystoma xenopodis]